MREKPLEVPEAADGFGAARKRVGATQSYVIASTPRSGSYLLCEALAATGVAGKPTEPFNPEFLWDFHQRWGLSADVGFQEYWYQAVVHGTTGNGVFGVKIQWGQLDWLAEQAGAGRGDVLAQLLPGARYVRLVRRDRRAQAISLHRASASEEIRLHPDIVDAALVSYSDESGIEHPCAVIVVAPSASPPDLTNLRSFLIGRGMSAVSLPSRLVIVEELPRDEVGKMRKRVLRDRLSSGSLQVST
jgi:Stf0 sulphotransferase